MSGAPSFLVDHLIVPGLAASDGARVAQSLQHELARLWTEDNAAGRQWGVTLDLVSLELGEMAEAEAIGQSLARAVRDQALSGEGRS
jgi:hypothetical protein